MIFPFALSLSSLFLSITFFFLYKIDIKKKHDKEANFKKRRRLLYVLKMSINYDSILIKIKQKIVFQLKYLINKEKILFNPEPCAVFVVAAFFYNYYYIYSYMKIKIIDYVTDLT